MTVDPGAFRRQVHEHALDAALAMLVEKGWDKLRFGEVATRIGISRPTLYATFGSKEGLAEALVLRETERFLAGIGGVLNEHEDEPEAAVAEAVRFTLAEAERSPVLHAILTSSRSGSDSLLPLLTTRSRPVLEAATSVLVAWYLDHFPGLPPEEVQEGVDALVRLVVSHLVLPADDPARTPQRLARLASRYLAMAGDSSAV